MNTLKSVTTNYRIALSNNLILSPEDKSRLLELDKQYGKLYKEFWFKWDRTDTKNLESEFKKFLDARKRGEKYYPN